MAHSSALLTHHACNSMNKIAWYSSPWGEPAPLNPLATPIRRL